MITEIGIAAGEIWSYLEHHEEIPFSELTTEIKQSRDLTLMSVGWLAREGHVVVKQGDGGDFRICLRKN